RCYVATAPPTSSFSTPSLHDALPILVAAADPSAQLVQLGQAELVGPFDDDGVGAGHVDAGLDDGRGHQDIEAAMVEIAHYLLQLAFGHLTVADTDARLGHQLGQI